MAVQDGRQHPSQTDSTKHTWNAERLEVKLEETLIDQSEEEKRQSTPDDIQCYRLIRQSLRAFFLKRERECHAGNEQEQREDRVVVMQPDPVHMVHLLSQPAILASRKYSAGLRDDSAQPHDEHHVKAPERIQRQESSV